MQKLKNKLIRSRIVMMLLKIARALHIIDKERYKRIIFRISTKI